MRARGNHPARRPASSCVRRFITFAKGSTALGRPNRRSPSGFPRHVGRASSCRRQRKDEPQRRRGKARSAPRVEAVAEEPSRAHALAPSSERSSVKVTRQHHAGPCRDRRARRPAGAPGPSGPQQRAKPHGPRAHRRVRPRRKKRPARGRGIAAGRRGAVLSRLDSL
jgi:hypothetical protein